MTTSSTFGSRAAVLLGTAIAAQFAEGYLINRTFAGVVSPWAAIPALLALEVVASAATDLRLAPPGVLVVVADRAFATGDRWRLFGGPFTLVDGRRRTTSLIRGGSLTTINWSFRTTPEAAVTWNAIPGGPSAAYRRALASMTGAAHLVPGFGRVNSDVIDVSSAVTGGGDLPPPLVPSLGAPADRRVRRSGVFLRMLLVAAWFAGIAVGSLW